MNLYLLNVAIPLFFFEWWYVLLAFIGVVFIESTILWWWHLSSNYLTVVKWVWKANLISTLGGYILQSLVRFFVGLLLFLSDVFDLGDETRVFDAIFANIGVGKYEGGWKNPTILYNFIIALSFCFLLSIAIEARLIREYAGDSLLKNNIWGRVVVSNLVSYAFLTWWLLWTYETVLG